MLQIYFCLGLQVFDNLFLNIPFYLAYYIKNQNSEFLKTFVDEFNIRYNQPSGNYLIYNLFKKDINNNFYEEDINSSFTKILYKSKKIISSIKLKKLQKNKINYAFFKDTLEKAKKNNQADNTLNAYAVEDFSKISFIDKKNYFFDLLFTKENEKNYISNNNYSNERVVEDIKIKNSLIIDVTERL